MSINTIISDTSNDIGKILLSTCPKHKDFKTKYNEKPFTGYDLRVPYNLKSSAEASVVGTSFDYIARFLVAKKINTNKELALNELVAKYMIDLLDEFIITDKDLAQVGIQKKKYENTLNNIMDCIKGYNNNFVDLVKNVEYLTALEKAYRTRSYQDNFDSLMYKIKETKISKEMYKELAGMAKEFIGVFIESDLVTKESDVVFNPRFGEVARRIGGADADIYIDGVLYDFKTTKNYRYSSGDSAQLWGYNILYQIARDNKDKECSLIDKKLEKIALYKARFGEIEEIDLSKFIIDRADLFKIERLLGYNSEKYKGIKQFSRSADSLEEILGYTIVDDEY